MMFYRRKILLSLLEACGGQLSKTDMEKLLFAFCRERDINYYDFFPYHFGCFSFLSYQDKRVLTQQGYLVDDNAFVLKSKKSVFGELKDDDKRSLREFVNRTSNLRGNALVRDIYLKYPYYACRSDIKGRILTPEELCVVDSYTPRGDETCLFSIGYEGLSIDAYINKLICSAVASIIDVRRNPISMKYGFSKTTFRSYLERAGIAYDHIPALGVASAERNNLETSEDYLSLFQKYASTLPRLESELVQVQQLLTRYKRVALTCFESVATSCHRHKITQYFQDSNGWTIPIVHIA
jgi:hypothetical protein